MIPFFYHGQDNNWVKISSTSLNLTLATHKDFIAKNIYVRIEPDNEQKLIKMQKAKTKGNLQLWQADIPLNQDKDITFYCFKIVLENQQYWLHGLGIGNRSPGQEKHFKYNKNHQPPLWVKEQIFYQIFPDRFANGNPLISVKDNEYCLAGDQKSTIAKNWNDEVSSHNQSGACEFFGGDLKGIVDKLDYLQKLGITSLYLNPIFTAPSNHKYDTTDYFTIDQHLGTNEEFSQLVENLHARGMKIVLDAVFNHTSLNHPWFDRYKNRADGLGAWQNPDSPYREFYQFAGDTDNYIGWNGISSLPKLNFLNEEVRDYFYQGENAVIKHWLRPPYQIDGWRFDVIHMLGEGEGATNNAYYVKAFRQSAKSINQDCFVLGEHFFEASSWLQGDQEDGAMNYYGFAHPVRAFFANLDISFDPCQIDAQEFKEWLMEAASKIPWQNQLSQLNQLDSHDTMRFLTMCDGNENRLRQALMFLFCWVGVPCIYYGTEVCLEGGHDPDNRRSFPWQRLEQRQDMLDFVKSLTTLRQNSKALQQGSIQWLYAQGKCLAFARFIENEWIICAINLSDKDLKIPLTLWQLGISEQQKSRFIDYFSKDEYLVSNGEILLEIKADSASILS